MSGAVNREPDRHTPRAGAFKRTYKACEACRKTKAKCEQDGISQSCLKCQREQRECVFPAIRSTKRAKLSHGLTADVEDGFRIQRQVADPATLGQGQASSSPVNASTATLNNPLPRNIPNSNLEDNNLDPLVSKPASTALRSEREPLRQYVGQTEAVSLPDHLQDQVVQTVVASSSDAVGLLFRAAGSSDSEGSDGLANEETQNGTGIRHSMTASNTMSPSLNIRESVPADILELWNQHRFVRQGWFTAREAVAYVQAFFTKLSSLSPVLDSFYAEPANHRRLILEEPLLCCTVLMISSRHHQPPGAGGAVRADFIHARLWRHIEHLVQRITFGSEKYSLAKSRTLGSIQALLLITEWHPRSLHFPPEYDGWDSSLAPAVDDAYTPQPGNSEASKRWREDVFEPAKRSDRLSWMLVGLGTTLAHELGVFKLADEVEHVAVTPAHAAKLRIRRLLYLYGTQLSLRLGCTSIFPQEALQNITLIEQKGQSTAELASHDREGMLSKWIDITRLLATIADVFFSSKSGTKQMLRTTRYLTLINHFQPLLDSWYKDYVQVSCPTMEASARKILLIEYYYARMYIHSIAIQALVDRVTNLSSGTEPWQDHEIWRSKYAQDFISVNEVRESSGKILTTAVELSDQGVLQYCPVRLYLRIVSASVFLLKSISLGSREADIVTSLNILERCISALQQDRADDIHLSNHYATLMARHVQRFRRNFRVKSKSFMQSNASLDPTRAASPYGPRGNGKIQDRLQPPHGQLPDSSSTANRGSRQHPYGSDPATNTDDTNNFMFDESAFMEDWLAQPFDPQIAPFGLDYMAAGGGIASDSLDFLWNMADSG
ncbi:hypothetical protein H2200_012828 [Cladophialophora chaetospira]|uniref:Zn(2)-C6 fungal-type domain-containing protein n=1 Tax=Cladophialophora chaetospira TaxID=386627 RepID=A0AA38WWV6_9EURO|nr:hypothetical protein H2200_012828 [Cladophialophora chaetospira]